MSHNTRNKFVMATKPFDPFDDMLSIYLSISISFVTQFLRLFYLNKIELYTQKIKDIYTYQKYLIIN